MRRTLLLLSTMGLTLLVASGLALVAAVGSAAADSSVVGPGESIQKAVNAADPGDTIVVRGVHKEDVVIRKDGIKLRGIDDAVIEAPARAGSPCSKTFGLEAICVLADVDPDTGERTGPRVKDVSVSGFTIRGFETAGPDGNAFLFDFYDSRNATITGNRIMGNVAGAVVFGRSIDATFANNDVIGDPRNATNGLDVEAGSRNTKIVNNVVRSYTVGIAVGGGEGNGAINTTIEGNDFIDNSIGGLTIQDSPGTKILSNVMRGNEVVGAFIEGQKSADAKVVGNHISGGAWGIDVVDTKRGSFVGNNVHDNCAGMFFEGFASHPLSGFKVTGNMVENNTRSCRAAQFGINFSGIGIALLGASGMEVTGNQISGNVPSGPTPVSGGIAVAQDPFSFGGVPEPKNNSVTGNTFGRNNPDIFWDGSGTGNRFTGNNCNTSVPTRLCD
jgi:parallel beta-helix repeat protein